MEDRKCQEDGKCGFAALDNDFLTNSTISPKSKKNGGFSYLGGTAVFHHGHFGGNGVKLSLSGGIPPDNDNSVIRGRML